MLDQPTSLKSRLSDPALLETRAYVGGEWCQADHGATFEVRNPARGDVIAQVADLGCAHWQGAQGRAAPLVRFDDGPGFRISR